MSVLLMSMLLMMVRLVMIHLMMVRLVMVRLMMVRLMVSPIMVIILCMNHNPRPDYYSPAMLIMIVMHPNSVVGVPRII